MRVFGALVWAPYYGGQKSLIVLSICCTLAALIPVKNALEVHQGLCGQGSDLAEL